MSPEDVTDVAPEVLRHRLLLSYDALAENVKVNDLVGRIAATIALPQVSSKPAAPPRTGATVPRGRACRFGRLRPRSA